jgi:hypothetical protein
MTTPDFETQLKHALSVATAPRSIVDEVMRQLPASLPKPAPRYRWRRSLLAVSLATPTVVAAILAVIFFFTGTAVRLTLADVRAAVERQAWVHIRYDVGPFKESWTNLRTGEAFTTRVEGSVVYINEQTNARLWYWKNSGVIRQDAPTRYPPGKTPRPWTRQTAWEQVVAPLEHEVATTQRANASSPSLVSAQDSLAGKPVIRFDRYGIDNLGHRFLYAQLWADPRTQLPVRVKTRLQLAYREAAGTEWSLGDYDFPATGPADLYALGVPRGTPLEKEVTTAPTTVQPVLAGINRAHDGFLKNYRAVVWTARKGGSDPIDAVDIIWRDGDKVRQDHHLPAFERQENHASPVPQPSPAALLKWATQTEATEKQLLAGRREYIWRSAAAARTSKPQVQVVPHGTFPLLATSTWPEHVQWPTRYGSPDFHLLDANAETPAGCIGLRQGGEGNFRFDYYIDSQHDYVCVKQVAWTKRGTQWVKDREYTLSDLHRIAGRVVAGSQRFHGYGDPAKRISASTENMRIDVVPLSATEYPPAIFDPALLTTGAKVEGY